MSKEQVDHPEHYNNHPAGIECIDVVEHFGFNIGNAIKYLWRCGLKGAAIEDLKKAKWYVERELNKRYKHENKLISDACTDVSRKFDFDVEPPKEPSSRFIKESDLIKGRSNCKESE